MKLNKKESYLIAVSGGPDSMYLLNKCIEIIPVSNLVVCHINYNFRPDSEKDKNIVKSFCVKNKIIFELKEIKVNYSNIKENFENFARNIRYDFFETISKKHKIKNLLTGHTLNDHVETYLMQKRRNNIVDYFGIQKKSKKGKLMITRPILNVYKSEILNYLNNNNITYAIDSTNFDLKYLRNKIRSELIEGNFKKICGQIDEENKILNYKKTKVNNVKLDKLYFDLNELDNMDLYESRMLLFCWLSKYYPKLNIETSKKNIINELLKYKISKKPFIRMDIKSFSIIKDRNRLYIIDTVLIDKYFIIDSVDDLEKIKDYKNFDFVKKQFLESNQKIVCTNNFIKYQNIYIYETKSLKRFYTNNKIPYIDKIMNLLVTYENNDYILNIL